MELIVLILLFVFVYCSNSFFRKRRKASPSTKQHPAKHTKSTTLQGVNVPDKQSPPIEKSYPDLTITGPAYIIDGDSLIIRKTEIRLYGVDAPEFTHPYGKKAKWALHAMCKGQEIRADVVEQDTYGRTVAICLLPDGRDLSAEMVKLGLALDWPRFSGGKFKNLEPEGIRSKLWLADARQKGHMHVWRKFEADQKKRHAQKNP